MFLSNKNTLKLDELVKSFEVAYRSYVSKRIIQVLDSEEKFLQELEKIDINQSSLLNSGKINGKLKKLKKNYKEIYINIKKAYNDMKIKDISINKDKNTEVLYVSELLDIIYFFANPNFSNLFMNFETKDQFIYYSEKYKSIRNDLSHPASAKISLEDTRIIIRYIKKILDNIDSDSFWYFSKESIEESIENLTNSIGNTSKIMNNLNEIAIQYKKIIGRDNELNTLNKWILGEEGSYRTANSVVIYGYGGIGKTTLTVEFIYELMKKISDDEIKNKYKYILFFSSKDEKLEYMHTNGDLYIDKVRQQISSFEEFKKSLCYYLNIDDEECIYKYMNKNEGLIIVDNIENLKDKDYLIDFIKKSPRSVQYIVTSRNEEMCEEKLNVLGFDEKNNGISFIDSYIEQNNLDLNLNLNDKKGLISASVGNTLILVTSLERISSGKSTIGDIINQLNNVSSYNTQQIADFMYKNTFDQTINELKDYNVESLLRVIALYEEPIDLYAMNEMTGIKIKDIEHMCNTLTRKLVLYRTQDLFTLNDFASKFIFSKILLDIAEVNQLYKNIKNYKETIKSTLDKLDKKMREDSLFEEVINDWKPQNNIDKISIASVFNLYNNINKEIRNLRKNKKKNKNKTNQEEVNKLLEHIESEFKKYELKTPHPYIRSQKARVYKLFLDAKVCNKHNRIIVINRIKDNFEEATVSVNFYYQYIKNTRSYAAFLWVYGVFLMKDVKDLNYAISILNQSKEIYDSIGSVEVNYIKSCNELATCYLKKYEDTKEPIYIDMCKKICQTILSNEGQYILRKGDKDFNFDRFRLEFEKVIGL